jgi:hypothetical protein
MGSKVLMGKTRDNDHSVSSHEGNFQACQIASVRCNSTSWAFWIAGPHPLSGLTEKFGVDFGALSVEPVNPQQQSTNTLCGRKAGAVTMSRLRPDLCLLLLTTRRDRRGQMLLPGTLHERWHFESW